jgi:hypothetical protein
MKEIDKIAFIEIQQGKILSTKSKTKYYIPDKRESHTFISVTITNTNILEPTIGEKKKE